MPSWSAAQVARGYETLPAPHPPHTQVLPTQLCPSPGVTKPSLLLSGVTARLQLHHSLPCLQFSSILPGIVSVTTLGASVLVVLSLQHPYLLLTDQNPLPLLLLHSADSVPHSSVQPARHPSPISISPSNYVDTSPSNPTSLRYDLKSPPDCESPVHIYQNLGSHHTFPSLYPATCSQGLLAPRSGAPWVSTSIWSAVSPMEGLQKDQPCHR